MEEFTVIYDDEDIIGKSFDIKKCFLTRLKEILSDNDIYIEEKINHLDLIQDIIKQLDSVSDNTIIKVSYNPMGAFYYKYLVTED